MKSSNKIYAHLKQLSLWLGLLFIPLTVVTGIHQYQLYREPFDLKKLSENEAMLFDNRTLGQLKKIKHSFLTNSPRPDILLTGNHVMRNFTGSKMIQKFDLINYTDRGDPLNEQLKTLEQLKSINRLPKKMLVYTLLAHGGGKRLLSAQPAPTSNFGLDTITGWISDIQQDVAWFFGYNTYLEALFSLNGANTVINYATCFEVYKTTKNKPKPMSLEIKWKISEYIPAQVGLNTGLLSIHEFCQSDRNINLLYSSGLTRKSGFIAPGPLENSKTHFHPPYAYPVLSPKEAKTVADKVARRMNHLERFARQNDFRIVYLIPPRYEVPLNGPNDEVLNLVFENNPEFTVVDFRRYSLETKYYVDGSHLAQSFEEILIPCLEKILQSEKPLPRVPVIKTRGRTVCAEELS